MTEYLCPQLGEVFKNSGFHKRTLCFSLLIGGLLLNSVLIPGAVASTAAWSPTASEKLIKLPGKYLERAVESDYRKSPLAAALETTENRTKLKQATLGDLQQAIERAEGEVRLDLQHQFLIEKKSYVEMLKENQDLRVKRAKTKLRLYGRLLGKLSRKKQSKTPGQKQLVSLQKSARQRLKSSASKIDMKLMQSVAMGASKYSREYARNLGALESLVAAVNDHPANQSPTTNGVVLSQADYLRQLVSQNEAELALVNQERIILSHMARLVSLDALALTEETQIASEDLGLEPVQKERGFGLEYFINQ